VDGSGSINGPSGQANFTINSVRHNATNPNNQGSFSYNDPNSPLVFSTSNITNVVINGNQASFSGTAQIPGGGTGGTQKKRQISFTVNVTDNGTPGTLDTFSISTSSDYSASGNLTSGDIMIH
jgi:hypothetical protein